jgi:hypothetical protein
VVTVPSMVESLDYGENIVDVFGGRMRGRNWTKHRGEAHTWWRRYRTVYQLPWVQESEFRSDGPGDRRSGRNQASR